MVIRLVSVFSPVATHGLICIVCRERDVLRLTTFKCVVLMSTLRPTSTRVGRKVNRNTDGMPCVEIKDMDLLKFGLMVIRLGSVFHPLQRTGSFASVFLMYYCHL